MKTKNTTNSRPAGQLWNSTTGTYTRRDVIRAARTLADGCKIDNYIAFGLNGRNGITEATATDSNGRKIARIYRGPLGYQAETLAMNYASQWHATERAALSALFISKEFAYLRQ